MEDKLLKIISFYGVLPQLKYFQSEIFEMNEAIIEYETLYNNDSTMKQLEACKNHIAEEIADVMVMLEQFKLYYGITSEEITEIFWSKVDRQIGRIEKQMEQMAGE